MADRITSIIQIATIGSRLSLLLNAEACQLMQYGIDIHVIPHHISLFTLTLKNAGQMLGTTKLHALSKVVDFTWEIAHQAQLIFIDMQTMVNRLQSSGHDKEAKRIPVGDHVKSCFRKRHINYLLACLDCFKLNLIVMIQVLQLAQLISTSSHTTTSDDEIGQEKGEIQTMMVNLYWTTQSLDDLWSLAELDAKHAAKDSINHRINSTPPRRIHSQPDITFWSFDLGLGDLNKFPEAMSKLSETAMNRLFSHWFPLLNTLRLRGTRKSGHYADNPQPPHMVITSDSERDPQAWTFKDHHIPSYPPGTTTDRGRPQLHQVRHEATKPRQSYSAHVKSEAREDQLRGSNETKSPQRVHTCYGERRASGHRSLDSRRSGKIMSTSNATDGNPVHDYHYARRTPRHHHRHSTSSKETGLPQRSRYRSPHRSPSRFHHFFYEERRERPESLRRTVIRWLIGVLEALEAHIL